MVFYENKYQHISIHIYVLDVSVYRRMMGDGCEQFNFIADNMTNNLYQNSIQLYVLMRSGVVLNGWGVNPNFALILISEKVS